MTAEMIIDKPRRTLTASVVAVFLVLPASLVAAAFRWLIGNLILRFVGEGIVLDFAPNLIFGLITGMIAVGTTHFLFGRARLLTVATSISIVWAVIYGFGLGLSTYLRGVEPSLLQGVTMLIGIALGSFTTAKDNATE